MISPLTIYYSMIESRNYTDTYIVREKSLLAPPRQGKKKNLRHKPVKNYPILLGSIKKKRRKKGRRKVEPEEPIYLVERKKPRDRILNLIQTSAAILNNSKAHFYSQIEQIVNCCAPDCLELAYTDTGKSCVFVLHTLFPAPRSRQVLRGREK